MAKAHIDFAPDTLAVRVVVFAVADEDDVVVAVADAPTSFAAVSSSPSTPPSARPHPQSCVVDPKLHRT